MPKDDVEGWLAQWAARPPAPVAPPPLPRRDHGIAGRPYATQEVISSPERRPGIA
jgi:hypothetical protein